MPIPWKQKRVLHGVISVGVASITSAAFAWIAFWASAKYFVWKYPHDGMDGLGALAAALFVLPVSWIIFFAASMRGLWLVAWKRQQRRFANRASADAVRH
jgi:hypothetical protein